MVTSNIKCREMRKKGLLEKGFVPWVLFHKLDQQSVGSQLIVEQLTCITRHSMACQPN